MKKIASILIIEYFMIFIFNITTYAYAPLEKIEIDSYSFDEKSEYIELLIKMGNNNQNYISYNEENMLQYNFNNSNIKNYKDKDGYISFSCHYKGVITQMKIEQIKNQFGEVISRNCFTLKKSNNINSANNNFDVMQDLDLIRNLLNENPDFKIAVIDKYGDIKQISDKFTLVDTNGNSVNEIRYNISENKLNVEWNKDKVSVNKLGIIIFLVIISAITLFILFMYKRVKIK